MGQYVTPKDNIDYATVSNSLDNQIKDLKDRREKQRSQMKSLAESIAQKRKAGDTRQFQYTVDQYGGVKATDESESYLDFFKTKDKKLDKIYGGKNTSIYKLDNAADKLKDEYNEYYNDNSTGSLTEASDKVVKPEIINKPDVSNGGTEKTPVEEQSEAPKLKSEDELQEAYRLNSKERMKQGDKPVSFDDYKNQYYKNADILLKTKQSLGNNEDNTSTNTQSENTTSDTDGLSNLIKIAKKNAGKGGSYSVQESKGGTSDSQATNDLYIKQTETTGSFGGSIVNSDYNDLVANQMASNSNNAWGHGSNTEIWKTLADKAYEETQAYNKAQVTRENDMEIVKGKDYQYSHSESGDSKALSVNPLDPNTSTFTNGLPKPRSITVTTGNNKSIFSITESFGKYNGKPTPVWNFDGVFETPQGDWKGYLDKARWINNNNTWTSPDGNYTVTIGDGNKIQAYAPSQILNQFGITKSASKATEEGNGQE